MILADVDNAAILMADVTEPHAVLDAPKTRALLDFDKPIGLLAMTLFHYVGPRREPYEVIATYRDALVGGSYFAMSHFTNDLVESSGEDLVDTMKNTQNNVFPRSKDEIARVSPERGDPRAGCATTWSRPSCRCPTSRRKRLSSNGINATRPAVHARAGPANLARMTTPGWTPPIPRPCSAPRGPASCSTSAAPSDDPSEDGLGRGRPKEVTLALDAR